MNQLCAFITGATSGIGLGVATHLAEAGYAIGFNGLASKAEVEEVTKSLTKAGAKHCYYYDADMRDAKAIRSMMKAAEADMGKIDALVNNAGVQFVAPIEEFPSEKWDEVLAVNLTASFHTIASVLEGMRKRKHGRIINIASVHGLIASGQKAAYVSAKHGLIGLTKTVALETASEGITVNAICPGWVRTPLVEEQIEARMKKSKNSREDEARDLVSERQPSGEFVEVEALGSMVRFLIESEAAASITGSALPIDGGWTAQ